MSLLSATLGALSVGLLSIIAYRLTRSFGGSLVAGLLLAVSRDFWSQAVIAEVYTLNVLLILSVIWCLFSYEETLRTRWLYLTAFTVGLGLTNHSTMGPLAPVFFGWVFLRHRYLFRNPVLLVNLAGAFLLGFSIILYLPIRSAADPVMDWGDPETLSGMWRHLLRRDYTEDEVVAPRTAARQLTLLYHFAGTFIAQFAAPAGVLAVIGGAVGYARKRSAFFLLAPLFALTSAGFIFLLNYPPDRENLHLTRVFFLPAYAVAALAVALLLREVSARLTWRLRSRRRLVRSGFALGAGGLIALPLALHFEENDRSGDYLACDWGRNILESVKEDAVLLCSSDHSTFPTIYLQAVEGLRPDVVIANKYGYIEDRVFEEVFEGRDPPRHPPPLGKPKAEKERFLVEESGRPVYFSTKAKVPGLRSHELVTSGLLYEAVPTRDYELRKDEHRQVWKKMEWHAGSLERKAGEFGGDLILSDYYFAVGRLALLFEKPEAAVRAFRKAARYGAGIKGIFNNLGGALAESGKPAKALEFLLEAARLDPAYELAVLNLANSYFALERYAEGLPWFRKALEHQPRNFIFLLGRARGYKATGSEKSARYAYESLLFDAPTDDSLWKEFEEFMAEAFEREEFEKFRNLFPERSALAARRKALEEEMGPPVPDPRPVVPEPGAAMSPLAPPDPAGVRPGSGFD